MIWDLIYICFMNAPIGSEIHKETANVIAYGTAKQAKKVHKKYCF
jgi:hypothetical protein